MVDEEDLEKEFELFNFKKSKGEIITDLWVTTKLGKEVGDFIVEKFATIKKIIEG